MNIEQHLTLAAQACEKKDFAKAKSFLEEILSVNPGVSEAHRLLGQIAYEENDDELAINCLIEALFNDFLDNNINELNWQ